MDSSKEFEEEIVEEYFKHWIKHDLNLGQYKSELWCACGDKLQVDGHAQDWHSSSSEVFYRHIAEKQAALHHRASQELVRETLERLKANSYMTKEYSWGQLTRKVIERNAGEAVPIEAIDAELAKLKGGEHE